MPKKEHCVAPNYPDVRQLRRFSSGRTDPVKKTFNAQKISVWSLGRQHLEKGAVTAPEIHL
jgi:hypothetical protein